MWQPISRPPGDFRGSTNLIRITRFKASLLRFLPSVMSMLKETPNHIQLLNPSLKNAFESRENSLLRHFGNSLNVARAFSSHIRVHPIYGCIELVTDVVPTTRPWPTTSLGLLFWIADELDCEQNLTLPLSELAARALGTIDIQGIVAEYPTIFLISNKSVSLHDELDYLAPLHALYINTMSVSAPQVLMNEFLQDRTVSGLFKLVILAHRTLTVQRAADTSSPNKQVTVDDLDLASSVTSHPLFRHIKSIRDLVAMYPDRLRIQPNGTLEMLAYRLPEHVAVPATNLGYLLQLVSALDACPHYKHSITELERYIPAIWGGLPVKEFVAQYNTLLSIDGDFIQLTTGIESLPPLYTLVATSLPPNLTSITLSTVIYVAVKPRTRARVQHVYDLADPPKNVQLYTFAEQVYSLLIGANGAMAIDLLDAHPQVTSHLAFRHLGSTRELALAFKAEFQVESSMLVACKPVNRKALPFTKLGRVTRLVLYMESGPHRFLQDIADTFTAVGRAAKVIATYPMLFKRVNGKYGAAMLCAPAKSLPPVYQVLLDMELGQSAPPPVIARPVLTPVPSNVGSPSKARLTPSPPRSRDSTVTPTSLVRPETPSTHPLPKSGPVPGLGPPYYAVDGRALGWRIVTGEEAQASFRALIHHSVARIALDVDGTPGIDTVQLAYIPNEHNGPIGTALAHVFVWEFGNRSLESDRRILKALLRELLETASESCQAVVVHDGAYDARQLQQVLGISIGPPVINTQLLATEWTALSRQVWDKLLMDGLGVKLAVADMENVPWGLFQRIAPPMLLSRPPNEKPPLNTMLWAAGRPMNWHKDLSPGVDVKENKSTATGPEMRRFEARLQDVDQLLQAEDAMSSHIRVFREYLGELARPGKVLFSG
ncbi:hypothetical protein BC828DRAFT_391358 [Blastocladiella britannica]|nr:hypothetical protein BC828DRAFT_391358 [Blastocladiella britannica]